MAFAGPLLMLWLGTLWKVAITPADTILIGTSDASPAPLGHKCASARVGQHEPPED